MARTRAVEHEEEGEGYFASISDLMVGVLFVFLLMLTVFALNLREQETITAAQYARALQAQEQAEREKAQAQRERAEAEAERDRLAIEAAQQKLAAFRAETENRGLRDLLISAAERLERDAADRRTARTALLRRLQSDLARRGLVVDVVEDAGVLRLPSEKVNLFDTDSSAIRPAALPQVATLAEVLGSVLPCYSAALGARPDCPQNAGAILETLLVEGHSDQQQYASGPALSQQRNLRLSTDRALAVFAELNQRQRALTELRNQENLSLLGVSGYGDRRPLPGSEGGGGEAFARNRRIDLRLVLASAKPSEELARLLGQIRFFTGSKAPP